MCFSERIAAFVLKPAKEPQHLFLLYVTMLQQVSSCFYAKYSRVSVAKGCRFCCTAWKRFHVSHACMWCRESLSCWQRDSQCSVKGTRQMVLCSKGSPCDSCSMPKLVYSHISYIANHNKFETVCRLSDINTDIRHMVGTCAS